MTMKIYLNKNVYTAALERVRWIFEEFPNVIVGHSGGKDSVIVFNLALQVARELDRLPVNVLWIDQEAEWQATEDLMKKVFTREDVNPYWLQVPFRVTLATNYEDKFFYCWDPDKEEQWVRPKSELSFKENVYGFDKYIGETFNRFIRYTFKDEKAALIGGVRCEESPARNLSLTGQATYKWATWGKTITKGLHYSLYPIYDWSYMDVWKAIHENGWDYNRLYDAQYQLGLGVNNMRCAPQIHETGIWNLFYMQEFEPDTHDRLAARQAGIDSATKFGLSDFYPKKLPTMFASWKEYRDYLLEKLIEDDDTKEIFRKKFAEHEKIFSLNDKLFGTSENETAHARHVNAIIANDWFCTKLDNLKAGWDNKVKRAARREYLKQEGLSDVPSD